MKNGMSNMTEVVPSSIPKHLSPVLSIAVPGGVILLILMVLVIVMSVYLIQRCNKQSMFVKNIDK